MAGMAESGSLWYWVLPLGLVKPRDTLLGSSSSLQDSGSRGFTLVGEGVGYGVRGTNVPRSLPT